MEFWGVEVKSGQPFEVNLEKDQVLHLSQACLGEIKNNKTNESVCLHISIDDKKLVLGTLNSERLPQQLFDLVIDKDFQLSHNWKNGSVYFYGYKADQPIDDNSDSEDSDSDEEDALPLPIANGKQEEKKEVNQVVAKKEDSSVAEAKKKDGKQKVKIVEPEKDEEDDEDDSDSDAGDSMSEDSDSDEDDEDSSDGEDSSDEDEETPKKMEQKHISCGSVCDRLPTHSLKYPWFLARSLKAEQGDTKHQIMYALYEIRSIYYAQISGLTEKRVRGCFHGWVIISHNVTWSLWNPVTSKMIDLPPLEDGDCESIEQCVLTYPPNHPASVFMLTRTKSPTIVLCQLGRKVKRLRWKEMTYAKEVRSIIGDHDGFLRSLTCCNGKLYAFTSVHHIAVQVDIVVKDKEHVISLFTLGRLPHPFLNACPTTQLLLKGYRDDLFYIKLDFYDVARTIVGAVYLFKLNRSSMIWDELEDLKDVIFFISIIYNCSVFYRDAIASELGGYAHMILGGDKGRVIYSYDVKDKTISLSPMAFFKQSSQWERELHGDDGEKKCETPEDDIMVWDKNEEDLEPHILDIPFDVLKMIMELCVGVEYLNFRATCKRCQLAAPMIQWRNETSVKRLQTYSLISPWLIVLDKHQDIITFIDPMFGDRYFMKTPQELTGDLQICCSRYGWLLLLECTNGRGGLFFFNPFTSDIRKLPDGLTPDIDKLCFSHPPTSTDCVVVGLSTSVPSNVFIHIPSSADHSWTRFHMDFGGTTPHSFRSPTIRDENVYALNHGALHVFFVNDEEENIFTNVVVAESPRGKECSYAQYFLANCDKHHFVLVMVDEVGESVEVLKLNDSTHEWEKLDSLGRHMIYICGAMCLCVEAKTPEMENKIYFPLLHSKTGNIMFYSLETRRYHTFNGSNIQQGLGDFFGTKFYVHSHAWIQPSWS